MYDFGSILLSFVINFFLSRIDSSSVKFMRSINRINKLLLYDILAVYRANFLNESVINVSTLNAMLTHRQF